MWSLHDNYYLKGNSFSFQYNFTGHHCRLWDQSNSAFYFDISNICSCSNVFLKMLLDWQMNKERKHTTEHTVKLQWSVRPLIADKSRSPGIAYAALAKICNIPRLQSSKSLTQINTWSWVWKREIRLETGSPRVSHSDITWKEALRTQRNEQQTKQQKPVSCNAALLVKPDLSPSTCQAD